MGWEGDGGGVKSKKKNYSEGILKLSGIRTGRELVLINPRCFVQWRGVGKMWIKNKGRGIEVQE